MRTKAATAAATSLMRRGGYFLPWSTAAAMVSWISRFLRYLFLEQARHSSGKNEHAIMDFAVETAYRRIGAALQTTPHRLLDTGICG
jgi:hypothetical protein